MVVINCTLNGVIAKFTFTKFYSTAPLATIMINVLGNVISVQLIAPLALPKAVAHVLSILLLL